MNSPMIPVRCRTNLDLFNEKWPTHLPAIPAVGNYIQSKKEWKYGDILPCTFQLTLEVYSVTWVYSEFSGEWVAEIELHIRKVSGMSLVDFYNYYAPKVGLSPSAFI